MEKDNPREEDFDQELHEHFSFKIDSGQEPLRIDKFLMSRIENATRNGDCHIKFWNADGTESGMCGNALRCVGDIILSETKKNNVIIETVDKDIECWRNGDEISVNIGEPSFHWSEIPLSNPCLLYTSPSPRD